jgi:hypothetical protein
VKLARSAEEAVRMVLSALDAHEQIRALEENEPDLTR